MYGEILESFTRCPREVHNLRLDGKITKWFYVFAEGDKLYYDKSKEHPELSANITSGHPQLLRAEETEKMYELYLRRKEGESVSRDAAEETRQQIYWYGIFGDMGL